ncbi:MAG: hypothetical protein ACJAR0_000616, partial [Candidatus Azotimanducaceae bacterium]
NRLAKLPNMQLKPILGLRGITLTAIRFIEIET